MGDLHKLPPLSVQGVRRRGGIKSRRARVGGGKAGEQEPLNQLS